jgi:molybdopterin-guanine dinucleotide biosynthesis protein A
MKVLGVIIAGGKSSRMGQEKALMGWQGRPLIAHVVEHLMPQVEAVAINANGDAQRFGFLGLPVFADELNDIHTPLAGLYAALAGAANSSFDAVLTVPCDGPFLPLDLRQRLEALVPAIAASAGQKHYLTGLWPVALRGTLQKALGQGQRRVQDFVALAGAASVDWPILPRDPFANINTPEDFKRLSEKP